MSDRQPKPCLNPKCLELGVPEVEVASNLKCWRVICESCGMRGPITRTHDEALDQWDAMPRREEFYAELLVMVTKLNQRAADYGEDGDVPHEHLHHAYVDAINQVVQMTYKYAPPHGASAEPSDGDEYSELVPAEHPSCPECGEAMTPVIDKTEYPYTPFPIKRLGWTCLSDKCVPPGGDHADD